MKWMEDESRKTRQVFAESLLEQISCCSCSLRLVSLVFCAVQHRVPRYSDVCFQLRQSVPVQTVGIGKRQNSKHMATWTPELRHRHRSQIRGSPSKYSQRHREQGCACDAEEMRWRCHKSPCNNGSKI